MTDVAAAAPTATTAPANGEASADASQPNPNMTGEEAKAWVESQKAKKDQPQKAKDPYMADGKKESDTPNPIKEAAKEAKRRLKISDTEEVDEDEVLKIYRERKGHQQAASREFNEGKLMRKQAEEFIAMMRDPDKLFEVAKQLGHDPRALSEKQLVAALQDEMADPRDKELKEVKKKLDYYQSLEKKQEEEARAKIDKALREKYAGEYQAQFIDALEKENLPKTKPMVAQMAKYISRAAKLKFDMTAKEAAQLVREDLYQAHINLIGNADGEVLINLLGQETANKIRKWDTSRVKDPSKFLQTPTEQNITPKTRGTPTKRMTPREWREYNRR